LLNFDDANDGIRIEQNSIVTHPETVAVFMVRQGFHVLSIRKVSQESHGVGDAVAVFSVNLGQLLDSLLVPVDFEHSRNPWVEQL